MRWFMAAALWCGFQDAPAAEITGVVKLKAPKKVQTNKRYPNQAGQPGAQSVVSPAVVYLEKVEGSFPAPKEKPKMSQQAFAFHPRVLPVQSGTTVDFPNLDDLYHNVFSFSSTKKFDLGRYPSGESKSVTFDKAGLVKIYCEIHEHMRGFVLVLQNPYFATTDEKGAYSIKNIPPGRYMLKVWQEDSKEMNREVVVESGKPLRADFELSYSEAPSPSDQRCLCKDGE
jgi:plastocyanin